MTKEIGEGTASILVYDKSFKDFYNSEFKEYLHENGFEPWSYARKYETSWVYVNINSKIYARGMPGIGITKPLGHHAVTIEEFKTIYSIYNKYEGKELLKF